MLRVYREKGDERGAPPSDSWLICWLGGGISKSLPDFVLYIVQLMSELLRTINNRDISNFTYLY